MKRAAVIALLVLGAAFALGLARLYSLRFETGDVYEPYSSLRADPLGTRAFYESLDRLLPAQRNYRPLSRLDVAPEATLFWLGEHWDELDAPRADLERLEAFVSAGGRLVLAFRPVAEVPRFRNFGKLPPGAKKVGKDEEDEHESPIVNLTNRWRFSLGFESLPAIDGEKHQPATAQRVEDLPLPETLLVHTVLTFAGTSNEWRVIYARTNGAATMIEKHLGRGSIVLCADAFPFSNEALLKARQSSLLAWLTGPARRVVFDEAHLGVSEDPGIATLARRYRLHGLFGALLVLAGLYVWKNSASLVPRRAARAGDTVSEAIAGRDSATGFINLLRRSVPRDRLLATCLEQWNADCLRTQRPSQRRLEEMQAIVEEQNALAPKQRDPVATYRRFVRVLQTHHEPQRSGASKERRHLSGEELAALSRDAATPQSLNSRLPSSSPSHEH